MPEKLKPLNMSFNEALARLSKVPKNKTLKGELDKKGKLPNNNESGESKSPPHVVKKG